MSLPNPGEPRYPDYLELRAALLAWQDTYQLRAPWFLTQVLRCFDFFRQHGDQPQPRNFIMLWPAGSSVDETACANPTLDLGSFNWPTDWQTWDEFNAVTLNTIKERLNQFRLNVEADRKAAGFKRLGMAKEDHFTWLVRRVVLGHTYRRIGDDFDERNEDSVRHAIDRLRRILEL